VRVKTVNHAPGQIRDGYLDEGCGRFVLYDDFMLMTFNHAEDHNYLLRKLASRYQLPKNDVISNALRFYFCWSGDGTLTISGTSSKDDRTLAMYDKRVTSAIFKTFFRNI
jgi:hypothetical protein